MHDCWKEAAIADLGADHTVVPAHVSVESPVASVLAHHPFGGPPDAFAMATHTDQPHNHTRAHSGDISAHP
jgi:hypothetical protein